MKNPLVRWLAAALAATSFASFGISTFADEPDEDLLFTVLQRDDDAPRRRPDGDQPRPGARGRGSADRGPGERDRGPGDRGPETRPRGRGDFGRDGFDRGVFGRGRPGFAPPGGPIPGARRGGDFPGSIDARIARLEQKLDTVLREIRSLRSDRPPLALMSQQRTPAGPPAFGMRGGGPRPPMGPPPFARRGGDGDRFGPPPRDGDERRFRSLGPPDAPRDTPREGMRGGMRGGGPPRDGGRPGGARSGGPPRDEDRPASPGRRGGGPEPRRSDRSPRDPDLTF